MKALILSVFVLTGSQLCHGYQTKYDDMKVHNFQRNPNARTGYIQMLMALYKEGKDYMHEGSQIILKCRFCAPFEVGYVFCALQERYRRIVEKYHTAHDLKDVLYLMEEVLYLTDVELEFWTIDHIVNALQEVEKKYLIFNSLTDPYKDTMLTRRSTASLKLPNMSQTADFQKKRRGTKTRTRNPRLKFSSDFFSRYTSAVTRSKNKRFWWPIEYGWEIDWDWNDDPNFKKDILYHQKSDINYTVTEAPSYEETEAMDKITRE